MKTVRIGARCIGETHPCFVIAEAGSNHNGSFEQALKLIDVAVDAGADGVKFQVFRALTMYPKGAGNSEYLKLSKSIYDIIAEMEIPYDWLPKLAAYCEERGVEFLASVFDEESVDRLDPYVRAFKVASYEMTHTPLIQYVAAKGKPVIVSTGTADLAEVGEMVAAFRGAGNDQLVLMQCTAAYPAPLVSLNIRAISTMSNAFDLPVGFSDHSRDPLVGPVAAAAVGAAALEKHFTLSNLLPGPDHRFAVEPSELRLMVQKVHEAEQALGSAEKAPQLIEAELRAFARRSIFATTNIVRGAQLTPANVAVLRCGNLPPGLPPKAYPELLGRRVRHSIPAESAIRGEDLE